MKVEHGADYFIVYKYIIYKTVDELFQLESQIVVNFLQRFSFLIF
jgi:hypothetical protein